MLNKLMILVFAALIFIGCTPKNQTDELSAYGKIFSGNHPLINLNTDQSAEQSPPRYMELSGAIDQTSKMTLTHIKFAWKLKDGTQVISSLPISKVMLKIMLDSPPSIKFRWSYSDATGRKNLQQIIDDGVLYAIITVDKNDWPLPIHLPVIKP